VKSVLGEVSSSMFICANKGPQSDLGPSFYQVPRPGIHGALPPFSFPTKN